MRKYLIFVMAGYLFTIGFSLKSMALADVYIKESLTIEESAFGWVISARKSILEAWMDGQRIAAYLSDMEGNLSESIIVQKDEGRMYLIDHTNMEYEIMDYPPSEDDIDIASLDIVSLLMRFGFKNANVQIIQMNETRFINNLMCSKYQLEVAFNMAHVTSEIWASHDLGVDKYFSVDPNIIIKSTPSSFRSVVTDIVDAYDSIDGFPVLATINLKSGMVGGKVIFELLDYSKTQPPEEIYKVPFGYALSDAKKTRKFLMDKYQIYRFEASRGIIPSDYD